MIKFESDHPDKLNLHFFAVPPNGAGSFQGVLDLFEEKCEGYQWNTPPPKVLRNILITPISIGPQSIFLDSLRKIKQNGFIERVIFDSGGFQLMTGSLAEKRNITNITDLIERDMQLYQEHSDWVDGFMLLDDPPTLADTYDQMEKKIEDTINVALEFFHKMPEDVQRRSIPIYHCRHLHQIDRFTEAYQPIMEKSKFVSFSAASCTKPGSSRTLDSRIVAILKRLVERLKEVHCLGIVSPLAVFLFAKLGIRTFDGSSAIISAGNGEVYLPYLSAVTMTRHKSRVHKTPTEKEFERMKEYTGHHCPFCEDMGELIENHRYRFLHNLIVQDQLSYFYKDLDVDKFIGVQNVQKYVTLIRDLLTATDQLQMF